MNKTIAITAGASILTGFLGMGAGYLAADGMPDVQTKTVTKEVAGPTHTVTKWKTKRVQVPGPTQVKWKTKVVTKEVTPQSCLDAIDDAEEVAGHVGDFIQVVRQYPPMVGQAWEAGLATNPNAGMRIIHHMKHLNSRMQEINSGLFPAVDHFNQDKSVCRNH